MSDKQPDELGKIQEHLKKLCSEKGWDKNSISEVFLLLNEEVGELARAIRKQTGFKGEMKDKTKENLEEELADVFSYVLEIANRFDIDLASAYYKKQKINLDRTWK
ncbi:MAG TPA: MazG nucleotide pyrophosphohydrolase domain-containing protein [Candidatus Saccharimonadales bacterium]